MSDHGATVFVGNLPWHTTEDDLARVVGQFGQVLAARIVQDRETGRSRGYGFVELAGAEQVAVCAALDGCQLDGRSLEVRPARPKPERPQYPWPPQGLLPRRHLSLPARTRTQRDRAPAGNGASLAATGGYTRLTAAATS